jgi:hypothetical protein
MNGKGSAHIFVYYQQPGKFSPDTGEWEQNKASRVDLIVTEGTFKSNNSNRQFWLNLIKSTI